MLHTRPLPFFSALGKAEALEVLRRNHVGRLAFLSRGIVDIEPVHYVAGEGWIFVRSATGGKLEAFAHHPYVAFEVDEIDDTFDWRSVVVHGTIYVLPADGAPIQRRTFAKALRALRTFIPETLTTNDPTPFRRTVYGIHIDALVGRAAESGPRSEHRRPLPPAASGEPPRAPDVF